jgi:leucyl/phenylalanyl-tRNA---protein transferase
VTDTRLTPELLELCYRNGAFPMADPFGGGVELYRADPRAVLELDELRVSKSLARTIRSGRYSVRVNEDFAATIRACAERRPERRETWIDAEIIAAFLGLHERGLAHSVEAYREDRLVGGLYGVAIGGAFMGESMFSRERDASKVCLYHLVERLKERGFVLLDCQIQNDHMYSLGAREIPESEYLRRLDHALSLDRHFA